MGIPLLVLVPFVIIGLGVVALVGFTGVAARIGASVALHLGFTQSSEYFRTVLGVLTLLAPLLVARFLSLLFGGLPLIGGGLVSVLSGALGFIGFCLEYVAWTIGFGAAILAWIRLRRQPQAIPAQ